MIDLADSLGKLIYRNVLNSFCGLNINITTPDGRLHHLADIKHDSKPAEILVSKWSVFWDMITGFDLGFAQSYIDGKWDSSDLTYLFETISRSNQSDSLGNISRFAPRKIRAQIEQKFKVSNNRFWAKRNIQKHYDLSNQFFQGFLDPSMTYSSAVFSGSDLNLERGQQRKVNVLLEASKLKETDHILDIGCGWGSLITMAASKYGCKATGVTLSENQYRYCLELIDKLGLGNQVTVILGDYRNLEGNFDHIFSVEMIEAVGHNGLDVFFELCARLLNDNGSIQLQAINIPHQRYDKYRKNCDFIQKYIFPGGLLPSLTRMSNVASKHSLFITESTSIGYDYFLTLEEWKKNLTSNWQAMLDQGFNIEFMRRFDYYFSYCAGAFKSNHIDNHQISFRKRQSIVV